VHEIPLLIFPPWINKFYILDLTAEKSFIRWAVEQGLSVFVVSWAQGSPALADVVLDSYVLEGMVNAIDQVLAATGAPAVHSIGYCVAGTTLAITLAWMAANGQADKVATATYFTAQVDFTDAGELLNFCTPAMLDTIDQLTAGTGYTDGRFLATTFNLLRPTDLMWNYVVNNYLKGKDPMPFDLLYWNSDATHVPARWHKAYIRDLYIENRLAEPGGISVAGTPIDLTQIRTPSYIQAGKDDHIAPAVSCFKLTRAFSGPHRFMLAGSGHIAGVVNPPSSGKYQHWILPVGMETPATLDAFREKATEVKGSWWPDWIAWLAPQSGPMVPARIPGEAAGFAAIEDAPGRYVKERLA
jgi:polyhydroxyalkanoate synthase